MSKPVLVFLVLSAILCFTHVSSLEILAGEDCAPPSPTQLQPHPSVVAKLQALAASLVAQPSKATVRISCGAAKPTSTTTNNAGNKLAKAGVRPSAKAGTNTGMTCGGCSSKDVKKLKKMVKKLLKRQQKLKKVMKKEKKIAKKPTNLKRMQPALHVATPSTPSFHRRKRKLEVVYNKGQGYQTEKQKREHRIAIAVAVNEMHPTHPNWTIKQKHLDSSHPIIEKMDILHNKLTELSTPKYVEAIGRIRKD